MKQATLLLLILLLICTTSVFGGLGMKFWMILPGVFLQHREGYAALEAELFMVVFPWAEWVDVLFMPSGNLKVFFPINSNTEMYIGVGISFYLMVGYSIKPVGVLGAIVGFERSFRDFDLSAEVYALLSKHSSVPTFRIGIEWH